MAWDLILVKTEKNAEPEFDENNLIPFDLKIVKKLLKHKFSGLESRSDAWFNYEAGNFAISFNLAVHNQIILHIHILDDSEDAVESIIEELCELFNCRAYDTTAGKFL